MEKEKLTLVIVDDEPRIVDLVHQLIDWSTLGIEFVGSAHDGISAKQLLMELKPDILISDIRMPGDDGLELARYLQSENIDTSVIIISGYKEFEYAHVALKYGVVDFLVKPINKTELNKSLNDICNKRRKFVVQETQKGKIQLQFEESRHRLRKEFVFSCIHGLSAPDDVQLINDKYFFNMEEDSFCALALRMDNSNNCKPSSENFKDVEQKDCILYKKIFQKAEKIFLERFYSKVCDFELVVENSTLYVIANVNSNEKMHFYRACINAFNEIKDFVHVYSGYYATMGVSDLESSVERLTYCLKTASRCIKLKVILGSTETIFSEKQDWPSENENFGYDLLKKVRDSFHTLSLKDIKQCFNNIFEENRLLLENNPAKIGSFVDKLFILARKGSQEVGFMGQESSVAWSKYLFSVNSYKKLQLVWNEYLEDTFIEHFSEIQARDKRPIRIAKNYINVNFNKQLTLDEIAKSVNLSSGYLCTLFKQEANINVLDYIIDVRLENAKKMLETTSKNISEIAYDVGYTDAKYFSKLFTKRIGLRPKEYRKYNS